MSDHAYEGIQTGARRPRPAVLMVIDGLGVAADNEGNAITRAKTPYFDLLKGRYPVMNLKANGEAVGLSWGEMGNSEVGHLTIGAGRVFFQSFPRIERAIQDKSFAENPGLLSAIEAVKASGGTLHITGILSAGNVHGSNKHIYALLDLARAHKLKDVAIHAILDGRDTLYNAGIDYLNELLEYMRKQKIGRLATMSGRFYAMDRDNRWDRIEKAYNAIALGKGEMAEDPVEALKGSYMKEVYDEEFVPTVFTQAGAPVAEVKSGDAMIFSNFRADRARELTQAFVLPSFLKFERAFIENLTFVTMTEYEKDLPVTVAFGPEVVEQGLSEILSNNDLVQLHIAETEKYAHVTFFFNGTREEPFPHEDRVIIPSPKVASYDKKPEMSAKELTARVVKEVETGNYDVIIMNYANPDMVAHTGNFEATVTAMGVIDSCVKEVCEAVLAKDGVVFITGDHGNAEEVKNLQTGDIDKEHSTNPVPLYIVGNAFEGQAGPSGDVPNGDLSLLPPIGMLADVAPTFLKVLGIPQPDVMTGSSLL